MRRIEQLKIPITDFLDSSEAGDDAISDMLRRRSAAELGLPVADVRNVYTLHRSFDFRRKNAPQAVYTVDVAATTDVNEANAANNTATDVKAANYAANAILEDIISAATRSGRVGSPDSHGRPVVVGFGPAGMFCALMLAQAGAAPIIIERGGSIEQRQRDVELFWQQGTLNTQSNVQFGEGGAGAFSDGKLTTLVKEKNSIGRFVMETLCAFGAPRDILISNKPHIGTDLLRDVVVRIREEIIRLGGNIYYNTTLTDIDYVTYGVGNREIRAVRVRSTSQSSDDKREDERDIETSQLFLCIGHSARDTVEMLLKRGVKAEPKAFAVGVRIEHLQSMINEAQYGSYAQRMGKLYPADYKLAHHTNGGEGTSRGVYTFCMCPGGYVVNASSETGRVVTNGMSYHARDSVNANSAVLVSVTPDDYKEYGNGALAGVAFQRELEQRAYELGGSTHAIPQQRLGDFLRRKGNKGKGANGKMLLGVTSCFKGLHTEADVRGGLAQFVYEPLCEGLEAFGRKIRGFDADDAIISGYETRSSSPVRLVRDRETMESDIKGLYPVGEGAGYAGGIVSSAIDGVKAAIAAGAGVEVENAE